MAGTSYTRQSTLTDGDTITASLFNTEYNQLVTAFSYAASGTTGHQHDGGAGEGGNIHTIGDQDFLNKIVVDSTNNRWGFFVEVSSSAVEQVRIQDGAIVPVTDSDIDLGTTSLRFKDTYTDTITTTGNVAVGGNLTVTGTATIAGNLTFGDAASDTVAFSADIASHLLPSADATYDLGATGSEWNNLFIDGTANIDSLVADTADINGGTIDGAVIGGSSAAAITGTAITGTSFVIGSATITEAELEILDGATVTTAELNILDGVTATATEINLIDGVTATTAELNILDGVTASATDINLIDGITNGTVIASKAIITDSNKDISGGRNITISGELDAGSLDISGDVDVDGTLETDALTIAGVTLAETISDTVGAMVASNTETGVTVTYEDSDNTLDFVIGADAIVQSMIADDAIDSQHYVDGSIDLAHMSANSVDSDQYVDGSIDTAHIADSQITSAKIADGTIATGDIADDAVTGAKLANNIDVAGTLDVTGVLTADSNVIVAGNLTVNGTTTTLNTATLDVEDKNITINYGAGDTTGSANGAGLTIQDAVDASTDATILWDTTNDEFDFSHPINVAGKVTSTGTSVFASLDISGDIDVDGTTNLDVVDIDGAVDMASTLAVGGVVTANAGVVVDNITIDGTQIDLSSGDLTLDVAGSIILDADSDGRTFFYDGGTEYGIVGKSSNSLFLKSSISDGDILFQGNDGGSTITALTLDMSAAGAATFNSTVTSTGLTANVPSGNGLLINSADISTIKMKANGGGVKNWGFAHTNLLAGDFGIYASNSNGGDPITAGAAKLYFTSTGAATFSSTIAATSATFTPSSGETVVISRDSAGPYFGNSSNNSLRIITNNATRINISNSGNISTHPPAGNHFVINEDGIDSDFRVESDSNTHALFVDGGTSKLGINKASPDGDVHLKQTGDIGNGNAVGIMLESGVGSQKWIVQSGLTGVSNSYFNIRDVTAGTNVLSFVNSSGAATFSSSVSTPTLSSPDGTGILTLANTGEAQFNRGIVVNEGSFDSDFRVESASYSSCLHVNAGDNSVNFHKAATSASTSGFTIGVPSSGVTSSMPSGNTYHVYRSDGVDNGYKFYVNFGGQILSTSTSISSLSDERLKENIVDLETGLTEVIALKPRRFDWKGNGNKNVVGFIAQEVETVLPELIGDFLHDDLADAKSVKMGDMIPTLVKAIQEQQTLIETLTERITALENA